MSWTPDRVNARIKAFGIAKAKGYQGLRYLGTSGGNHVLRDRDGRLVGVDLVLSTTCLYAGLAPRIFRY